jgi:hypothetical protein
MTTAIAASNSIQVIAEQFSAISHFQPKIVKIPEIKTTSVQPSGLPVSV